VATRVIAIVVLVGEYELAVRVIKIVVPCGPDEADQVLHSAMPIRPGQRPHHVSTNNAQSRDTP
jgi:hypothetical protein